MAAHGTLTSKPLKISHSRHWLRALCRGEHYVIRPHCPKSRSVRRGRHAATTRTTLGRQVRAERHRQRRQDQRQDSRRAGGSAEWAGRRPRTTTDGDGAFARRPQNRQIRGATFEKRVSVLPTHIFSMVDKVIDLKLWRKNLLRVSSGISDARIAFVSGASAGQATAADGDRAFMIFFFFFFFFFFFY